MRKSLKDPDSTRFGPIIAGVGKDDITIVCGWVNSKNSYGGYSGMSPFMGLMVGGGTGFELVGVGNINARMCHDDGLDLPPI